MRAGGLYLALVLVAFPAFAANNNASAIHPYLEAVPSCNPALGSDCAVVHSEPVCAEDSECVMGCAKGDKDKARCLPVEKANPACPAVTLQPLTTGVACGCMPATHHCGFIPVKPE